MLSSYIQNRNCVHCLMNKCEKSNKLCSNKNNCNISKNDIHILSKYVNDPLLIEDLENNIKKMDIKIENFNNDDLKKNTILKNGFMYTTCLFCLSKNSWNICKNVKEGRFNNIQLENGTQITYCYPDIKNVKHRLQIGLHIDLNIENNNILYQFIENKIENNMKDKIKYNMENNKKSYLNILKNNENDNYNNDKHNNEKRNNENITNENITNENNDMYNQLYKNYIDLKNNYEYIKNKKTNKNIEQIAFKTQLSLLNIQIYELETILNNFNKNYKYNMDTLLDNEIKMNFNKIF